MHKESLKTKRMLSIIVVVFLLTGLYYILCKNNFALNTCVISNPSYDENELKSEIEKIYNKRSALLVGGDISSLKDTFDTSQKYGRWALEHEVRRIKYLKDWSDKRGIKFTNIDSKVRLKKIHPVGANVRIALEETYKFDYVYKDDSPAVTNSFGVGIRHTLNLIKKEDKFIIYNDWYTDCFEDALSSYSGETSINEPPIKDDVYAMCIYYSMNNKYILKYNREKAVEYADKYCGAAFGSGNNFKYNKKYMDFNGRGGDCTNYVSQVLGDKEGAALPFDYSWYCKYSPYGNGQGSTAWVNADGLKNYLMYSGRGRLIKKGDYKGLTAPLDDNPMGAIGKIKLGDLVCYEKKGNIDHFAVVTGFDSKGYPLINSHTTDRYHVPWDLGWGDKKIKFLLIHING